MEMTELYDILIASGIASDEIKKEMQCVNIQQIPFDENKSIAEQLTSNENQGEPE